MSTMKKKQWYSRSRSSSIPTPREEEATATPGCMSMVHYLIFAPGAGCVGRPPSSHPLEPPNFHHAYPSAAPPLSHTNKGLEAPRNSLELDGDQLKDIQIGVQIEPAFDALARSSMRPKLTAPSSEAETPRTPSLVARLMGIDGLPEQSSPSPAHSNRKPTEKKKRVIPESMTMNRQPLRSLSCNVPGGAGEARSLPDTPRGSTSSSVLDHPRLSLQVLKENVLDRAAQYMSMPTSPTSKKKNHRRREAAKEIVRQAKETVTKRKSSANKAAATGSSNKENSSPLVVLLAEDKMVVEEVAKPTTAPTPAALRDHKQHAPRVPLHPKSAPPSPPQRAKPSRPAPPPPPLEQPSRAAPPAPPPPQAVKCRRPDGCERFATRIKKPTTSTTTSQQLSAAAPPPAAAPVNTSVEGATSTSTPMLEQDTEYRYLRTVLEHGGFMRSSPGRPAKWHSVAAPVDPIVFHLLELELAAEEAAALGPLRHRWNRKLLFHVAQEVLAEVLDGGAALGSGAALLAKLWRRVRSFPAAECKVVADIDELVGGDLEAASVRRMAWHPAVVEQGRHVADEVADRVLDTLLGECVQSLSPSRAPASR